MSGWLVVDKPGGVTSRDVVNVVQKWYPRGTKVGHAGTLDPLATGVLVVAVGAATRLCHLVQDMPKTYRSRFRFGACSDTDDADGIVAEHPVSVVPSVDSLRTALSDQVGTTLQVPPAYSALKVAGRRAHDLARRGNEVSLAARPVRIDEVRLLEYEWPFAEVEVDCGKGTYIRAIARDVGARLGVGGLVQTLRRMRIGVFHVGDAVTLDTRLATDRPLLMPLAAATGTLPQRMLSDEEVRRFRFGQILRPHDLGPETFDREAALLDGGGRLIGIGRVDATGAVRPAVVIPVGAPP